MIPSLIGFMIFIAALFLDREKDKREKEFLDKSFKEKLKFNGRALKQAMNLKPLRDTLLFFIVFLFLTPSFKDYLDYFYNFDPVYDAYIEIIVFISVLFATIIYSEFLEDTPMRKLIRIAIFALFINSLLNILLVMNMTFGLNKFTYVSI